MYKKNIIIIIIIIIIYFAAAGCDRKYDWIAIGDSITWQDGNNYEIGPHKGIKAEGYQSIISRKYSLVSKNIAYAGLPITGEKNSILSNCKNKDLNSNLVTIFVGTNDFKLNKEIGSNIDLRNENTFIGALNSLIDNVLENNSNATIVLFTPLQRDNNQYSTTSINTKGYKLNDYREAILKIGNYRNIKVVDLYTNSGITTENLEIYTFDGLHPNNLGYSIIANYLESEIQFN